MLQWTDHGGGKRDEGTGMYLGIPGGCCSGQTMVEEREMKEQGWTLGIPGGCCSGKTMVGERGLKEQGWTWGFLEGVVVERPWWGKER